MGKLTTFKIELEGGSPVCFAGRWVSGKVIVELSNSMSMKGVYLKFTGKSNVAFKVGKHVRTREEVYFHQLIVLKGHAPQQSGDNITLEAGRYEFPFNFQLPELIPSSYEDMLGYIRYHLKSIINKPWKFDHSTKLVFTVVGICDLNMLPNVLVGLASEGHKDLHSIQCQKGVLRAQIQTDRKGYVPGEKVILKGEIKNNTSRSISYSKIYMEAVATFYVDGYDRSDSRKIFEVKRGSIEPGGVDSFDNLAMRIPPVPPSYLQGCQIIMIGYFIRLKVKPSFSSSLVVGHEVVIGTVPLRMQEPSRRPLPSHSVLPLTRPGENVPLARVEDVVADFREEAPPSYGECVWGRTDTRDADDNTHTMGDHHWAPSYPFYSRD